MDLIKIAMEKISIGCISTIYDVLVYRTGKNSFAIGKESLSINNRPRFDLTKGVEEVYRLTRA